MGIKIIREMTKEEMIEELLDTHRVTLNKAEKDVLKSYVIQTRLQSVHERLIEEADIEQSKGILGMFRDRDDD